MKKFLTLFFILVLGVMVTNAQDRNEINPASISSFKTQTQLPAGPNAIYDLLRNHNVDSLFGTAVAYGVVWTGNAYIISAFNLNKFWRATANWTIIDSFTVTGAVGNFRDMAWAMGKLWGVNMTSAIYGVDPTTWTVVKTITTPGAQLRALTWDPVRGGFWAGTNSFTGPFVCYDTNGVAISGATITGPASGCYGIAYDDDPAGPFLWISTDQTPTSNTGTAFLKYNATTLTQIGSPINITVPLTTGAPLASGGCEIGKNLVSGKRTLVSLVQGTPDRVIVTELGVTDAGPLLPFNLTAPAAGTTITSIPGSSTPVTITWDTSRAAATYKFIYGVALPTRQITIPSGTNSLTMTLGALDNLLASLGLAQGDSISGQWDVWAFRNNDPQNDSLKSANGPRALKLKRQKPVLTAFSLLSPPTGTSVSVAAGGTAPVNITWSRSGAGTTYKWFYASPNFSTQSNIKLRIPANNSGLDSMLTLTSGQIDAAISSFVNVGDSTVGQWRVYAYSGSDSLASTQTFNITFKRLPIVTIGTGTTACGYPFYTFYMDARTQMLYTRNEVLGAGPGKYINAIGFNVLTAATQPMGSFTIKMGQYSDSSLTAFVETGLTTVYTNSGYVVPGTGWQSITLPAPYPYTGQGNLLIDICFDNTTFTSNSTVASTTGAPNDTRQFNRHMDNGAGCTMTAATGTAAATGRPNIQITLGSITGVNEPISGVIPTVYSLAQNYPNPFNPVTKINFDIPKQGLVTLKIYDMLGREVKSLVNEVKTAGRYSVDFNASEFSSGVYFYKLEAGNFSDVKKMMLIK